MHTIKVEKIEIKFLHGLPVASTNRIEKQEEKYSTFKSLIQKNIFNQRIETTQRIINRSDTDLAKHKKIFNQRPKKLGKNYFI